MAVTAPAVNPPAAGARLNFPCTGPTFAAGMAHVPVSNTAATLTLSANATARNVLRQVHYSYSAAPAAGSTLIVQDGAGTTVFTAYIAAGGPDTITFDPPLCGSTNTAMVVTLAAGGSGISGAIYLNAYTE